MRKAMRRDSTHSGVSREKTVGASLLRKDEEPVFELCPEQVIQ